MELWRAELRQPTNNGRPTKGTLCNYVHHNLRFVTKLTNNQTDT
jgi:hypothetical protein